MSWLKPFRCMLHGIAVAVTVLACDGGAGDPCQVESDCDDGLLCCGGLSFGTPTRGVCATSCAMVRDDASTEDAKVGDAMMSLPDGGDAAKQDASDGQVTLPDADTSDAEVTDSQVDSGQDATVDASADAADAQ